MSEQREKDAPTLEQFEVTLGIEPHPDNRMSGGMIEHFREGWALHIMGPTPARVAHWFARDGFGSAESLCKLSAPVRWLYGRGNYPCCKRCVRALDRMNSAAIVRSA